MSDATRACKPFRERRRSNSARPRTPNSLPAHERLKLPGYEIGARRSADVRLVRTLVLKDPEEQTPDQLPQRRDRKHKRHATDFAPMHSTMHQLVPNPDEL